MRNVESKDTNIRVEQSLNKELMSSNDFNVLVGKKKPTSKKVKKGK